MTTTEDSESLVNRIIAELESRPEVKPALLRALLTDEFLLLPAKVDRLMDDVSELKEGQERLEGDVSELKEGQERLEGDVSELKEGQERLEGDVSELKVGQARLERGQQRMGGQLSNLTGSQYQRHVAEIGYRLVRRELGIQDAHLLDADSAPGRRMIIDISDAAEAAGRITADESDELILSDIILAGVDETSQSVQVLLEVSLTVQQYDIERAQARARILEKANGIRTLVGVVGENVQEEERTQAQGRGIACIMVKSG